MSKLAVMTVILIQPKLLPLTSLKPGSNLSETQLTLGKPQRPYHPGRRSSEPCSIQS